jgi:hypothetical protein
MAIGWLSILKAVPWNDVVGNAPKVADGAKKLWEAVARKSAVDAEAPAGDSASTAPEARTMANLEARVGTLAGDVSRLKREMIDSSRLIKALADQNTQLIRRVYWLSRALFAVGLAAVISLILVLLR